ncbi:MAG: glucosamine-6-phosphate deaminase [Acidobacteriota bacterium]|nr:glucosamine-6-phosphate deaminase [Acidobacteriota bacterium]
MKVRVFATEDDVADAAVREVAAAVRLNPSLVLGLPTGRTPLRLYERLVAWEHSGRVSFSRVTTFNLDEFVGIASSHESSYRAFMEQHLFGRLRRRPFRVNFLDGQAKDLDRELKRYDRALQRAGGIDLQILGLGANGHIGFNEPGAALNPQSHRVRLHAATRRANADRFGGQMRRVPREALTVGMSAIMCARRVLMIATGERKAEAVTGMMKGDLTTRLPASFLQLHGGAVGLFDRAAASGL